MGEGMGYEFAWEAHGVYKRFFGTVTASEFMELIAQLPGDIRRQPSEK